MPLRLPTNNNKFLVLIVFFGNIRSINPLSQKTDAEKWCIIVHNNFWLFKCHMGRTILEFILLNLLTTTTHAENFVIPS
jgi:hypothetical protein